MKKIDNGKVVENEFGASQSDYAFRYDLIPKESMELLSNIFKYGADKYEAWNWENIPIHDHINHAIGHILNYFDNKRNIIDDTNKEPELSHALCRLAFACYLDSIKDGKLKIQSWDEEKKDCNVEEIEIINLEEKRSKIKWLSEK
jgi:hypothetical protein